MSHPTELFAECDVESYPDEAAWLASRDRGIGASEAATICGLNPFQTPLQLYAQRKGMTPPTEQSEAMEWGHTLEPIIAQKYAERANRRLAFLGSYTVLRSRAYPFLTCTLDRLVEPKDGEPGMGVLELKSTGAFSTKAREWDDDDESIPPGWAIQVQQQMAVTGLSWGVVAALIGGQKLRWRGAERKQEFIDSVLLPRVADFWKRLETNDPPAATGDDLEALKFLFPGDNGETVDLPPEAAGLVETWRIENEAEKEADKKQKAAKAALIQMIGNATFGKLPDGRVLSLKTTERGGYQVAATSYRTLREVKGGKK